MAAFPTTPVPRTLLELSGATPRLAPLAQSVLVIIDAQNEYVHGSLPLAEVGTAIAETARLLAAARRLGAPVVHVVHHSASGRPLFAPGTHGAEIVAELTPASAEPVVLKRLPNAFAGTGLADMLARLAPGGRTSLVLAGFMTYNCVAATARAALDLGYPTTIVAAATATRDLPDPCGGAPIPAHVVQSATLAALADRTAAVVADTEALLGIAA